MDEDWGETYAPSDPTNNPDWGGPVAGGDNGGANGSGGGDGTLKVTDIQKAQADNLPGVSGYNFQTPQISYDLTNKALDIADKGNENITNFAIANSKRSSANEWYKSQQDLQSVASQLTDASGNAMSGSGFLDTLDLIARRDDQADVEVLNTARDNENQYLRNKYEALQQNINSRNSTAVDTQEAMRNVAADYAAQLNNINPTLTNGIIDKEGHTINLPDWLKSDGYAEGKFVDAVDPKLTDFFRPAMDADTATKNNLINRTPQTVNNSSTNKSYWQRMREGYGRRNQ